MRIIATCAAVLLLAAGARGEVRLVRTPDGPALRVQVAPDGALWSPIGQGRMDDLVNAAGDLSGDGIPGQATGHGELLAAWGRSSSDVMVVLHVDAQGARHQSQHAIPGLIGVPRPLRLGEKWFLGWTSSVDGSPRVEGAWYEPGGGLGPIVSLQDGRLLRASSLEDAALLVSVDDPSGEILLTRIVHVIPLPAPIPDIDLRSPIRLASAGRGIMAAAAHVVELDALCVEADGKDATVRWSSGRGTLVEVQLRDGLLDGPWPASGNACQGGRSER